MLSAYSLQTSLAPCQTEFSARSEKNNSNASEALDSREADLEEVFARLSMYPTRVAEQT